MQTQTLDRPETSQAECPWLERVLEDGTPQRIPLDAMPFTIGRVAPANYRIESGRVSRAHAAIEVEESAVVVRDLGSTNGTLVNGDTIEGATVLNEGDLLVIADVELVFHLAGNDRPRDVATQLLATTRPVQETFEGVLRNLRRLNEVLTQRVMANRFRPIVRLSDGSVFAYESPESVDHGDAAGHLLRAECRLTSRLHQLQRLVAAEAADSLEPGTRLFLDIEASEVDDGETVCFLRRLARLVGEDHRLVAVLPAAAVSDTPVFREFQRRLREHGIEIALGDFASRGQPVRELAEMAPEMVELAASLIDGIAADPARRDQVQGVVTTCHDLGIKVVAGGIAREDDAAACREIGCEYGLGPHYQ